MKIIYNGVPINSLNIKHYELSSNDCDMIASDMQAGKTAVARGKKITGTGKSFEFAYYGALTTNSERYVPNDINVIEVASLDCPIKSTLQLGLMKDVDFSNYQTIGTAVIDGSEFSLTVSVNSNILTIFCDKEIQLQVFYGKDKYV